MLYIGVDLGTSAVKLLLMDQDGKIQKIGQNVILCSPAEIGVQGTISLGSPDDFEDED